MYFLMSKYGHMLNGNGSMMTFASIESIESYIDDVDRLGNDTDKMNFSPIYVADGDEGVKS